MSARAARLALALIAAAAAIAVSGCGSQKDVTVAETEGVYLDLGNLKYQVQVSRQVNPSDVQDRPLFRGLPAGITGALPADEIWFAVFLRVENPTGRPQPLANRFQIEDTQGVRYAPLPINAQANPLAYQAGVLPGNAIIPVPNSPVDQSFPQGALLLFRINTASNQNRPLVFSLSNVRGSFRGTVDLDV